MFEEVSPGSITPSAALTHAITWRQLNVPGCYESWDTLGGTDADGGGCWCAEMNIRILGLTVVVVIGVGRLIVVAVEAVQVGDLRQQLEDAVPVVRYRRDITV